MGTWLKFCIAGMALIAVAPAGAALNIFACTPEWGSLSKEIGGDNANVYVATTALQDPHRVEARPSLIARARSADLVVCTGGYNTMVETASFASKALILPRQLHREEQRIRARRFQELGLVSTLDPRDVAPERLYAEVVRLLADPRKPLAEARARGALRLDGAQHFAELCSRLEVAS